MLSIPALALGVFVMVVVFFFTMATANIGPLGLESTTLLTSGSFAALFWGGLIIAGLVLPLVLLGMGIKGKGALPMLAALSSFLFLTGGLILRYLVVSAGISMAPPHYAIGQQVYLQTFPPQYVASFIEPIAPGAFDYAIVGVFFVILAAAYFVAARIIPTSKLTAAK